VSLPLTSRVRGALIRLGRAARLASVDEEELADSSGTLPAALRGGAARQRPDLATCLARASQRRPGDPEDVESFARLHARFADLDVYEANAVETTGTPEEVAAAVLATSRREASSTWSISIMLLCHSA